MTSWTFSTSTPKRSSSTTKVENCFFPAMICPLLSRRGFLKETRVGRLNDAFHVEQFRHSALDDHRAQRSVAAAVFLDFDRFVGDVEDAVHNEPDALSMERVHYDLDFLAL